MISNRKFSDAEFVCAKSRDVLPFECMHCEVEFFVKKNRIQAVLAGKTNWTLQFCSNNCHNLSRRLEILCQHCGCAFFEKLHNGAARKFCSSSCAATYNNTHKKTGTRRSKLEVWLEERLSHRYPNLPISYNDKSIGTEIDIYVPSLKLAIELNGLFHYEPIFGDKKLSQIQSNDANKFQLCQQHGISLCVIDVSKLKYMKEQNALPYLEIVTSLIDAQIGGSPRS